MRPYQRFSLSSLVSILVLLVPGFVLAQSGFVRPLITQPVNEKQLTTLRGGTHALARPEFSRGAAPASLPMERMLLVLKRSPDQQAALDVLLEQLQDSSSPNFHKWLTPEQFGKQFGPSDEDMQTVSSWLQSHGFQVTQVTKGRTVIEFSGTAAQVHEAFHTPIQKFVVNGENHWANASDPQIPSALVPVVAGPWSLHNFYKKPTTTASAERFAVAYKQGVKPEFTASNGLHALFPGDYTVIYNINPVYQSGINGTGATIAVVGRTAIDFGDVSDFHNILGIPYNPTSILTNGPYPGFLDDGEQFEAVLDLTWSGTLAPGAARQFVISASTNTTDGVDLSELYIVENNTADIMTESFGSCEAFFTQAEADGIAAVAQQAAAQGITYMVSSGDSGASTCDRPSQAAATHPISVNMLASTPFNIAVGGTQFDEHGQNSKYWNATNSNSLASAKSYIPENVWNESCSAAQCGSNANLLATGGGASTFFSKPSWQSGVQGIPSDGKRDLPDISLTAAGHDPYLLCFQRSCQPDGQGFIHFFGVSGTSASAPSFAAIMALVNQKTGSRQGQANYVLYRLAAAQNYSQCNGSSTSTSPAASCTFRDVTVGNNAVPGQTTQQYASGVGFDLATGLGSPNVANLVNNWASVSFTATSTTLGLSPTTNIAHGSSVDVNVSVTPSSGTVTPTGDVSLLTDTGKGVGVFTLSGGSIVDTTSELPGGTYSVKARYAGNGTFGSSESAPASVTVTPEASHTILSVLTADQSGNQIPFTGGPYGGFVYLRADVAGQSEHGIPTGVVYFQDSLSSFNSGPLPLNSGGNVSFLDGIFTLPAGQHSLTAFYTGDGSFNTSTSPANNFTITKAPTVITVQADKTNIGHGATLNLSASIHTDSFSTVGLNGTITFFSGATMIGSTGTFSSVDPNTGKAIASSSAFSTSTLPLGSNSITAEYSGDSNYATSTSIAVTVNVAPEFTPSLSSTSATVTAGQPATTTLTITGEAGFSGTVSFSCSGLPARSACSFNPATLNGSGATTVTVSTTAKSVGMLAPGERPVYFAWLTFGGMPLVAVLLLGIPTKRRWPVGLILVVIALLSISVGCGGGNGGGGGGGGGNPGTPHGTYPIVITAMGNGLSHTSTFTLTVQ